MASGGALLATGDAARLGYARATGSLLAPPRESQIHPHLAGIAARVRARPADRFAAETLREALLKLAPLNGHHIGRTDEANRQEWTDTAGHDEVPLSGETWETILEVVPDDTGLDQW